MRKEYLLQRGFAETPHLVLKPVLVLDIGRDRHISIGSLGTPNEMVFINQKHNEGDITDMVCICNFDYDGFLTEQKLDAIISIFK